jgi:hypothetical protein
VTLHHSYWVKHPTQAQWAYVDYGAFSGSIPAVSSRSGQPVPAATSMDATWTPATATAPT